MVGERRAVFGLVWAILSWTEYTAWISLGLECFAEAL